MIIIINQKRFEKKVYVICREFLIMFGEEKEIFLKKMAKKSYQQKLAMDRENTLPFKNFLQRFLQF